MLLHTFFIVSDSLCAFHSGSNERLSNKMIKLWEFFRGARMFWGLVACGNRNAGEIRSPVINLIDAVCY